MTQPKGPRIRVGMGTCGISAGAQETFDALVKELERADVKNAEVNITGCLGQCSVEPLVEVQMSGMPDTVYGNVGVDCARDIIQKHILNKKMVDDHVFDQPAEDIIFEKLQTKNNL